MDSKESISDSSQTACHLSDSVNSQDLFETSDLGSDTNSVNNQSNGKVPRPMDIDILTNFENTQPLLNGNNGARSKTICVASKLAITTKKASVVAGKTQDPNTENCSLSCDKAKDLLTRKSSHDDLYQNRKTSGSFSKQKSRHQFVKSSSLDSTTDDPSSYQKEWFYVCFLCNIPVSSAEDLQVHINKDHFDSQPEEAALTSTINDRQSQEKLHTCFICNKHLNSTEELQVHINRDHFDSPVKPVSTTISDLASIKAPNCGGLHSGSVLLSDAPSADSSEIVASISDYKYLSEDTEAEQNDRLIAEMLQKQYEQEEKEFKKLQDMYGMTDKGNYKKQFHSNLSLAVQRGQISPFEYHMYKSQMSESQVTGVDDGVSCTKGIISSLRKYYQQQSKNKDVWLCSDLDHYSGSFGDTGWGCGYRNLQMMLSALAKEPKYQSFLYGDYKVKNGRVASIKKLQQLIEHAWQNGFDRQGAEQLGWKLVDTKKWIGATEIVALLSSLKFKCRMVDVRSPSGQQQAHPKMFQWIRDYFKRKDRHEFRSPLYLQHQGHSRTVIGVEESHQNGNITLLVFDPACSKAHMEKLKDRPTAVLAQPLRKYLSSMTKDQYQIVAVVGILTESEWNGSKVLKSEKLT